ncbi:DNA repair protein RAD57 [Hypoxylon trugodes]|uniref:DNA repair protein RAD57 n=1 Tax=Hypoxylon trugodes TaxID=326681 RepID=UPI00219A9722|nr:DNA repair protein RAD57 [Hypoxylon trugodes]KAI1388298.1 DNA repair protein RAD57 [Hypoxylon trugodes]
MTDLSRVLPDFPIGRYANLLPTIEKHGLTTADLLTLQVPDIGRRTQLPLLDIKRLCAAVLGALHADLGVSDNQQWSSHDTESGTEGLTHTGTQLLVTPFRTISTLDDDLDRALGGGVPVDYVTEITGESGAGKTQLLLTLLLACQLPPPRGLGRPALYVSTEAPLSTRRLAQLLAHNPYLRSLTEDEDAPPKPSLDNIVGTVTPDLESQDHILTYQVPVEVARRNVGLLVLDSVAANYRAEFERGGLGSSGNNKNLAARSHELTRLGRHLHELARKHNLAVVVANQVADRFTGSGLNGTLKSSASIPQPFSLPRVSQESPLARRSKTLPLHITPGIDPPSSDTPNLPSSLRSSMPEPPPEDPPAPPALLLDHQQRWFTGWGDEYPYSPNPSISDQNLKTPSLGLVWSTQIASRISLYKRPVYGPKEVLEDQDGESTTTLRNWRRWMKVVFAPHVPGGGPGLGGAVEFEVTMGGLRGVDRKGKAKKNKENKKVDDEE